MNYQILLQNKNLEEGVYENEFINHKLTKNIKDGQVHIEYLKTYIL